MTCAHPSLLRHRRPGSLGGGPAYGKVARDHQFAVANDHQQEHAINTVDDPLVLPTPPRADQLPFAAICAKHHPEEAQQDLALRAGCVAGAAHLDDLRSMLREVGFTDLRIQPKDGSKEIIRGWAPDKHYEEFIVSAYIEAVKP
jgi:hypothetical protein